MPPTPPKKTAKEELLEKINAALSEYKGESNIPLDHLYWRWVNQLRSM